MDVAWTGTGGVTDTQSYSWVILNAIAERIFNSSFFSSFVCKRINRALPIEAGGPVQIPFLGIYLLEEGLGPDGDANHSEIRFIHTVPIGFQIVVKNNDPNVMLQILDQASHFIMNQLLRDDSFTSRWRTNLPDNVQFEAIPRGRIRERWGVTGATNETPVGERQLELVFTFRTLWYPTEFPELERITVRTGFPPESYELGETQQVTMVYEFNPDSVPYPLPDDTQPPTPFNIEPQGVQHGGRSTEASSSERSTSTDRTTETDGTTE